MIRRFWNDRCASYAIATVIAMLPIMGGVAFAVDYSEMLREKAIMVDALDAAGVATARQVVSGASDEALKAYARDFFEANLGSVNPGRTNLQVTLPTTANGGGTLRLAAELRYNPHFYPVLVSLLGKDTGDGKVIRIDAETNVQLKNTLEVALVLDNSGSMDYYGGGSGEKRIDLLKSAAKELVKTLADEAEKIKQVDKPVQFGLVPFAASVNVGADNAGATWMDSAGLSPIHHENFDWSTLDDPDRKAEKSGGVWRKTGSGWGDEEGEILSRFTLYRDIAQVADREFVENADEPKVCVEWDRRGDCERQEHGHFDETMGPVAGWKGCVEARPYPYNVNDAAPAAALNDFDVVTGDPATLFVPMFAPDEPGDVWETEDDDHPDDYDASNNWWNDGTEGGKKSRLANMAKYYEPRPYGEKLPSDTGPDYSCTTKAITPLVDVTTEEGMETINTAIEDMAPLGGTNVPEGMAWGWRVVSGGAPFTEGRGDDEKGNDKVVIVLTDGENTYYTPSSLGFGDPADTGSTYASYGYLKPAHDDDEGDRLFGGTDIFPNYSNTRYTSALNAQMDTLCGNAKEAGVMVITVALDLDEGSNRDTIDTMTACASESRFRRDPDDPSKAKKLFWNATSTDLDETFQDIADELSNLRIVG